MSISVNETLLLDTIGLAPPIDSVDDGLKPSLETTIEELGGIKI